MSQRKSTTSTNVILLKELFPHWNEDDLQEVLNDVGGVVESAVARISEGHASQFSTVQSKKEKKTITPQQPPSAPSVKSESTKPKSNSTRGRSNASRGQPATRGSFNPPRGPRGGSARSSTRQSTTASKPKDPTASNSATPAKWSDNKPSTSNDQSSESQKPSSAASRSWAQIAKPPSPKPEPVVQSQPDVKSTAPVSEQEEPQQDTAIDSLSNATDNIAWDVPSSNAQTSAWNSNEAAWGAEPTSAWHQNDSAWDESSKPSHSQPSEPVTTVNNVNKTEDSKPTQSQSSVPPGFGAPPKPNSRAAQRARQDAAVVMPGAVDNKSFGNAIGVQFGSLSLLDNATGYEEQPKQPNTTQPQQESVTVPQPEPASAPAPAPAASQPTQPATQQPATQQTDISAYTSQQPQQDVYGQYFQQPQQQQPQQPTESTQPITSQAIPPQFQQYNQTATPTPDAYSNVFSNLGAQPNQLSGGAFGQQTQNDYAALYNDQAQRDFALQQANYYGQQQQQQQQPSSFGRQIGQDDTKSVPTPSVNQATTPSISSQQTASGYPGITAPMPYYFNPYAAAYGAPNAAAFYGQAAASPYAQFAAKYPMYPGPAQPGTGFQQPTQPKPSGAQGGGNGATAPSTQSPYVQNSSAATSAAAAAAASANNVASPSPYQSYDPSTAYDSFLNQSLQNAGSPAISHQDKHHQPQKAHQQPQQPHQQHPQHPQQQQQPYNAFGSAYQAPPLFQTPSFSHYQGYGGWQAQQRYGQGYP